MTKRSSCQFRGIFKPLFDELAQKKREREKKTVEDRRRFETENELRLLKKVGVFSKIFFPFRKEDLKFKTDEEELEEKKRFCSKIGENSIYEIFMIIRSMDTNSFAIFIIGFVMEDEWWRSLVLIER